MRSARPNALELLEAVQEFLLKRAVPKLSGHVAFEARVAVNLLDIARREVEEGPTLFEADVAELARLLESDASADALEAELLTLVGEGDISDRWDDLITYLRHRAERGLKIANPKYLEES